MVVVPCKDRKHITVAATEDKEKAEAHLAKIQALDDFEVKWACPSGPLGMASRTVRSDWDADPCSRAPVFFVQG